MLMFMAFPFRCVCACLFQGKERTAAHGRFRLCTAESVRSARLGSDLFPETAQVAKIQQSIRLLRRIAVRRRKAGAFQKGAGSFAFTCLAPSAGRGLVL